MDNLTRKIEVAVKLLKNGQSYNFGNIRLGIEKPNCIFITGWTQYSTLHYLNKQIALRELENVKNMFSKLVDLSTELKNFAEGKEIEYNLAYSYGMGSIGICSEKEGTILREVELPSGED